MPRSALMTRHCQLHRPLKRLDQRALELDAGLLEAYHSLAMARKFRANRSRKERGAPHAASPLSAHDWVGTRLNASPYCYPHKWTGSRDSQEVDALRYYASADEELDRRLLASTEELVAVAAATTLAERIRVQFRAADATLPVVYASHAHMQRVRAEYNLRLLELQRFAKRIRDLRGGRQPPVGKPALPSLKHQNVVKERLGYFVFTGSPERTMSFGSMVSLIYVC